MHKHKHKKFSQIFKNGICRILLNIKGMAMLRLNKKDREMASNIARHQKLSPGHSQLDLHINCVLLQASLRRPSVPFEPERQSSGGYSGGNKTKSSTILDAPAATSKMAWSKSLLENRIAKGSAVMKATGSTWMGKSPKYYEKGFPNHEYDVVDASIMKLGPEYDFDIPKDPEFEKIIKSAHPKSTVCDESKIEDNIDSEKSCKNVEPSNSDSCIKVNNENETEFSNRNDIEPCEQLEFDNRLNATAKSSKDKEELCAKYDCKKVEGSLTFETENTLSNDDFIVNPNIDIHDKGLEVCNQTKKENIDEDYDIGLFFETCNQLKTENVDEVYDIGLFFEVCNQHKKENIDEVYDIGLFFEVGNKHENENAEEVYDIGMFFETCNQFEIENPDEVYNIGLFFRVCNQPEKENLDEVFDIGLFFTVFNQLEKENPDKVYDIRLFFETCNQLKKENLDEVYDIGAFFRVCNHLEKENPNEVYDIGLFFENCNQLEEEKVDEVYNIGLFFDVCDQIMKVNVDQDNDIGLLFENCQQHVKEETDEVHDTGLFFENCNQMKKENPDEVYDIDSLLKVCSMSERDIVEEMDNTRSIVKVCSQLNKENVDEMYDIGLFFNSCNEQKNENVDEVYDIGLFFEACDIEETKEFVIEEQEMEILPLPRLDENIDFDEDMFGILGVFCRSSLHSLCSGFQETNA